MQNRVVEQQENFSTIIAKIITIAIFGIPYLAISVLIVLIQNQYGTPTIKGIAWISVTVLAGLLLAVLHKKLLLSIKKKVKDLIFMTKQTIPITVGGAVKFVLIPFLMNCLVLQTTSSR